ncbi:MAG: type VI secretion system tip protein VgrG, partial [Myxococcales bacterium]|nr:type VI secretion system tip protein VgrG [Myxococcales bacterium]
QVLGEGLRPYEREVDLSRLHGEYPQRQHIVQYRERDLDFVHRLLEEQGIRYVFEQGENAERLVLLDDVESHVPLVSLGSEDGFLPMTLAEGEADQREDLLSFVRESRIKPTVARGASYDWRSPGVEAFESAGDDDDGPELEDYDFDPPSAGLGVDEVERAVRLRGKQLRQDVQLFKGASTATQLHPGASFELGDHPQGELNGRYLVVKVTHQGDLSQAAGQAYQNRFQAVPLGKGWVPPRNHSKPVIPGVQTATVTGDDEICTDESGRIQVQFHWDRKRSTTCYVPMVQPWAGAGWGTQFLPRVGMEVVVSFIDGNPDRPVVVGSLYNGANQPPFPLPGEKTRSGIRSNSVPGGGGWNELMFEDTAGAEEIHLRAQRNFNQETLNDHIAHVGQHQHTVVDGEQHNTVQGPQYETVRGEQVLRVQQDRQVFVMGSCVEEVEK